jgi:hypothetical protein
VETVFFFNSIVICIPKQKEKRPFVTPLDMQQNKVLQRYVTSVNADTPKAVILDAESFVHHPNSAVHQWLPFWFTGGGATSSPSCARPDCPTVNLSVEKSHLRLVLFENEFYASPIISTKAGRPHNHSELLARRNQELALYNILTHKCSGELQGACHIYIDGAPWHWTSRDVLGSLTAVEAKDAAFAAEMACIWGEGLKLRFDSTRSSVHVADASAHGRVVKSLSDVVSGGLTATKMAMYITSLYGITFKGRKEEPVEEEEEEEEQEEKKCAELVVVTTDVLCFVSVLMTLARLQWIRKTPRMISETYADSQNAFRVCLADEIPRVIVHMPSSSSEPPTSIDASKIVSDIGLSVYALGVSLIYNDAASANPTGPPLSSTTQLISMANKFMHMPSFFHPDPICSNAFVPGNHPLALESQFRVPKLWIDAFMSQFHDSRCVKELQRAIWKVEYCANSHLESELAVACREEYFCASSARLGHCYSLKPVFDAVDPFDCALCMLDKQFYRVV